ncbi:MAG TPA: Rid family hydrolase, partial [Vicinamibacteria bacterium]|nr:Rid family hydrolase [Vicinamibacteria bacterium]
MRRALWTGTVFVAGLAVGGGTLAAKAAPARRYINLPGRAVSAPFSDAVLVGDTLYLAGRIGFLPGTRKVPAGAEEEARLVLDQFKTVLAEEGMTMDDLVSVQVFCSDVSLF